MLLNNDPISLQNSKKTDQEKTTSFDGEEMPKTLQSHFVTTQHFPKMLSCLSISLASLHLIHELARKRRHKKTINYKNQLPSELNQITNYKSDASIEQ